MIIRKYQPSDLEMVKEVTVICFDGVTMEQNLEERFGLIDGKDWAFRKARHLDVDISANEDGVFVAEAAGDVIGYVTTRLNSVTLVGNIPNFAVLPSYRNQGIGRLLLETGIAYLRNAGMEYVRIETLEQNPIGQHLYPSVGFQEFARQIHYVMPLTAVADAVREGEES